MVILDDSQNKRKRVKTSLISCLDDFEEVGQLIALRIAPWLAPIGPAFLIGRAVNIHLQAPTYVAVAIAIAIEAVGIAATHTDLRAKAWNQTKRKTDPHAPQGVTQKLSWGYFLAAATMSVLLEVLPAIAPYSPLTLFVLAFIAYNTAAISGKITHWENERKADIAQREAEKTAVFTTLKAARAETAKLHQEVKTLTTQKTALEAELADLQRAAQAVKHRVKQAERRGQKPAETGTVTKEKARQFLLDCHQEGREPTGAEVGNYLKRSGSLGRKLKRELWPQITATNGTLNGKGAGNV